MAHSNFSEWIKNFNRKDYINAVNKKKEELENNILKLKNKLLYELISDKEYNDKYDELNKEYMIIVKEIDVLQSNMDKENMEKDITRNKLKEEIESLAQNLTKTAASFAWICICGTLIYLGRCHGICWTRCGAVATIRGTLKINMWCNII